MSRQKPQTVDIDYSKLKGKITEIFGCQKDFAKALNKSATYVTRYLAGYSQFTQSVILIWAECLQIEMTEIGDYFFTRKVN